MGPVFESDGEGSLSTPGLDPLPQLWETMVFAPEGKAVSLSFIFFDETGFPYTRPPMTFFDDQQDYPCCRDSECFSVSTKFLSKDALA